MATVPAVSPTPPATSGTCRRTRKISRWRKLSGAAKPSPRARNIAKFRPQSTALAGGIMIGRRSVVLLAVVGTILALAVPAHTQKLMPLRIAVHTATIGAAYVIAIRQGFYKQEGLDVEWRRFALGKDGRDAM